MNKTLDFSTGNTLANNSIIGGGNNNTINASSTTSFIGGGICNCIGLGGPGSLFGAISGGCCNTIDDTGAESSFGVIGGGFQNCVCAGTNHSSIFSGNGNAVAGSCSSILGGSGNSDGGFDNVFILGSGITGVAANTTHVNALWASAIPNCPGGAGVILGQVYWDILANITPTSKILLIG